MECKKCRESAEIAEMAVGDMLEQEDEISKLEAQIEILKQYEPRPFKVGRE